MTDYSRLEQVEDDLLLYASDDLDRYTRFIVEPVELLFEPGEPDSEFSAEDLKELQAYFRDTIVERLSKDDGYEVVTEPGPDVARIRLGIANVRRTIGILNISLVTKITGAGIGGAAAEGEMLDSRTDKQVAAAVAWGGGSRILIAGITRLGDAKIAMNRWAKDLRKALDELHGVD